MIRLALPIVFAVVIFTADTAQTLAEPAKLLPSASSGGELVGNSPESARKLLIDTLGSTEMVWNNVFANNGERYTGPTFVLYTQQTRTACGMVLSAMEPLYCASDRKIYLDLSFFREMEDRLGGCRGARSCMFGEPSWVAAGGLMAYGASFSGQFPRAAEFVDMILRGTMPADIPVEQPTKFDLVINLKTAKALGLTIPPNLLAIVDEVIE